MPRKSAAVLAPPIRAPMTISSPESEAIRIVVRIVAPKVDCLVVFMRVVLLVSGHLSMSAPRRDDHRCHPLLAAVGPPRLARCDRWAPGDIRGDRRPAGGGGGPR